MKVFMLSAKRRQYVRNDDHTISLSARPFRDEFDQVCADSNIGVDRKTSRNNVEFGPQLREAFHLSAHLSALAKFDGGGTLTTDASEQVCGT